ncbi:hypothetical protein BB561_005157 [Smittium simulii]|uniref:U6 snRNA phosphodiesterase 1 n=1 Tax=Smittium simulii TaxID=133385 RepID=A0A2T9YBS7_9FUNG|nr:hypothetical protein BB561_005157 [Smittium simulii]
MLQLVDYSDSEDSDVPYQQPPHNKNPVESSTIKNNINLNLSHAPAKVIGNWAIHFASECVEKTTSILKMGDSLKTIHPLYTQIEPPKPSSFSSIPFFSFEKDSFNHINSVDSLEFPDFHISITKPAFIKFHHINSIVKTFEKKLSQTPAFEILLCGLLGLANENKSKSFLAIKVAKGTKNLHRLLSAVNETMQEFSLPLFHKVPLFHASFAWAEGPCLSEPEFIRKLEKSTECDSIVEIVKVSEITLKIGNLTFKIGLLDVD